MLAQQDLRHPHARERRMTRELARLQAERDRANETGIVGPAEQSRDQRQQPPCHRVAHDEVDQQQDRDVGQRRQRVVERHERLVDAPARITRHEAHDEGDDAARAGDDDAESERVSQRGGDLPEHVLAARRRAEPKFPRRGQVRGNHVGRHRIVRRDEGQRDQQQHRGHHHGAGEKLAVEAQQVSKDMKHDSAELHARVD